MTLYTAVGEVKLDKVDGRCKPIILYGQQEMEVSLREMIVWTSLTNAICNYEEIKVRQGIWEWKFDLLPNSFNDTLNRLVQRKLVVIGEGETIEIAMFHLLKDLYITPVKMTLWASIMGFFHFIKQGMSVREAIFVFRKKPITKIQKMILRMSRTSHDTIAKMLLTIWEREAQGAITYNEKQKTCFLNNALAEIKGLYCNGAIRLRCVD